MSNNTEFDGNCQGDVLDLPQWSFILVTVLISILFVINVPLNIFTLKIIFKSQDKSNRKNKIKKELNVGTNTSKEARKAFTRNKSSTDLKNQKQAVDYFIATFLITDIFSALASPLWLLRRMWMYKNWALGYGFCVTFFIIDEFSSYVTSIMVLSITIMRFIAIYDPFYARTRTTRYFKIWIFIAIILCLPGVILVALGAGVRHEVGECNIQECYKIDVSEYANNSAVEYEQTTDYPMNCTVMNDGNYYWPDCTLVFDHGNYYLEPSTISAFISSIQVVYFYLPMGLILVLNIMSFVVIKTRGKALQEVSNSNSRSTNLIGKNNDEKQMLYIIWIINVIYFLGYIPYAAYWTWQTSAG